MTTSRSLLEVWLRSEYRNRSLAIWPIILILVLLCILYVILVIITLYFSLTGVNWSNHNGILDMGGPGWKTQYLNYKLISLWIYYAIYCEPYWLQVALVLASANVILSCTVSRFSRIPDEVILLQPHRITVIHLLSNIFKRTLIPFGVIYTCITYLIILYENYIVRKEWVDEIFWNVSYIEYNHTQINYIVAISFLISALYSISVILSTSWLIIHWKANNRTLHCVTLALIVFMHYHYCVAGSIYVVEILLLMLYLTYIVKSTWFNRLYYYTKLIQDY